MLHANHEQPTRFPRCTTPAESIDSSRQPSFDSTVLSYTWPIHIISASINSSLSTSPGNRALCFRLLTIRPPILYSTTSSPTASHSLFSSWKQFALRCNRNSPTTRWARDPVFRVYKTMWQFCGNMHFPGLQKGAVLLYFFTHHERFKQHELLDSDRGTWL